MTKQDRQKVTFLVVLLAVLGLTVFLGYRMTRPPTTTSVVQTPQQKVSTNLPSSSGAQIRLDLVEKEKAGENIGKRNLFQYQQAPPPLPPPGPRGRGPQGSGPGAFLPVQPPAPVVVTPAGPPPPPPLPPITLKYQGFAARSAPNGGFTAFLADDSRHYNVTVGEILMGKYRIASITDRSVDVEDLEHNRHQSLPLLK